MPTSQESVETVRPRSGRRPQVRDALRERLDATVTDKQARKLMIDVGVDRHGRISDRCLETILHHYQNDADKRRYGVLPPKAPKERYEAPGVAADSKGMERSLGTPWMVDWDTILTADDQQFRMGLGLLGDAALQCASATTGDTILHYLAHARAEERVSLVLERPTGRAIVDARNFRGHTALDVARARGAHGVADMLSCYVREHLADDHVSDERLWHLNAKTRRAVASSSCSERHKIS